jgi:hypothetical protein
VCERKELKRKPATVLKTLLLVCSNSEEQLGRRCSRPLPLRLQLSLLPLLTSLTPLLLPLRLTLPPSLHRVSNAFPSQTLCSCSHHSSSLLHLQLSHAIANI